MKENGSFIRIGNFTRMGRRKLQVIAGRLDIEKFCKNKCDVCDVKIQVTEANIDSEIPKVSCFIEN